MQAISNARKAPLIQLQTDSMPLAALSDWIMQRQSPQSTSAPCRKTVREPPSEERRSIISGLLHQAYGSEKLSALMLEQVADAQSRVTAGIVQMELERIKISDSHRP